jgi:cysteine desulfurase
MKRIYFDYNATTPLAHEVADAMRPYIEEPFGNPSCLHWAGSRARAAIEHARRQVATLIGCESDEVVFTSGGTESNNTALAGVFFERQASKPPHYIISAVEHPSVYNTTAFLERLGASVTQVPVDRLGRTDPESVRHAIQANTVLVSVMHANNEVGTIQPIAEIASMAHEQGALMHCDAAQSTGKIPVNVRELGVDLLTIAGHKMYAPQGVGGLFIRNGVELEPLLHGAGHEAGRRASTENVIGIVALGAACELAGKRMDVDGMRVLRDRFWRLLSDRFGDRVILNGHPTDRLPNTLNVCFLGHKGHETLSQIPELAASCGSACHDGSYALSPVLQAMGVPESAALGAIRFSLGRGSNYEEVEFVVEQLTKTLATPVGRR